MGLFGKSNGNSGSGKVTGRAAKPGEVVNKKAKPATGARTGTVAKSKPRTGK
jgi:hypothetical protein